MSGNLVVTRSELEFLLLASPNGEAGTEIRVVLGLGPREDRDVLARAGVASLLTRGLCELDPDGTVRPADRIAMVIAAVAETTAWTRTLGWPSGQLMTTFVLHGALGDLLVVPGAMDQFAIGWLADERTVAEQVARFVDSCLAGSGESAVVVQSRTGEATVGIAVARDDGGRWFVSDSERDPDSATPVTRDDVHARIGELLPVGRR